VSSPGTAQRPGRARHRAEIPRRRDPYAPYRQRRGAAGRHNARQRRRESRDRGDPGAGRQVARRAAGRRARAPAAPRVGRPRTLPAPVGAGVPGGPQARRPAVSRRAWLLVRDPGGRGDADRARLDRRHAACPTAAPPDARRAAAAAGGVPEVVTCADGLRRAGDARRAALPLPWRIGPVAGPITRLKPIERQGSGRCGRGTRKRRSRHAA